MIKRKSQTSLENVNVEALNANLLFYFQKKDPDADADDGGTEAKPISDQVSITKSD